MLHQTQRYPFPFPSSPKLSSSSLVEKGGGMGRMVKGGCLASKMIMEDVFSNLPPQASSSSPSSVVVAAGEDFFVDQLLNFNENDEIDLPQTPEHQKPQQQLQQEALVVQQQLQQEVNEDKDASFLSPPLDTAEEADLEWLSQFVDDTGCPYSSPFPPGYVKPEPEPKPEVNARVGEAAPLSLRRARRKKRARTGGRVWVDDSFPYYMPPPKKGPAQKSLVHKPVKNKEIWSSDSGPADPVQQQLRRCSHCGVQKTPQWRAGPNGSKTLCNACGVRYKSGRLLPEYRPAISPTFSSELHSNSHRKVLEMRMKKGGRGPGSPDSGQTRLFRPVSSFG